MNFIEENNPNIIKFNSIINFANSVLKEYNDLKKYNHDSLCSKCHPLEDVIRILGRNLQSQYLTYLLNSEHIDILPNIDPLSVMFSTNECITNNGLTFSKLLKKIGTEREIHLCRDLVLPWPWERIRFIKSIASIGQGRLNGPWKQDFRNHYVVLWLPIGIAWVCGGNHSIATGIIQGEGILKADEVYDISQIYDYVYCDGLNYKRKSDDSIISEVKNVEFAAIFEIGRIMVENSVSF